MNLHETEAIHETLKKQLKHQNYDVVDVVPIPAGNGDRMVLLRSLEEVLKDFDKSGAEKIQTYLIQMKHTKTENTGPLHDEPEISGIAKAKIGFDGVYLPDGKLNVSFLTRNADILFSSREYALSRNIYKTILQSGENSSAALFWMGKCFEGEGKFEEAREHYDQAIAYQPTLECFQRLASVLVRQKKDLQASDALLRALNLKNLNKNQKVGLYKLCGSCFLRAGKKEEAKVHLKKALELDPSSDEIYLSLGKMFLQNELYEEAKYHFQEAVSINPKNAGAIAGLGSCALAAGEKRAAHDYFSNSLNIELNNPHALFHLVKCAYEIKSYAAAARILEEYISVAPVNSNLLYSLAGLQFHLGRLGEAGETVRRILELAPDHQGARELESLINRYER